jgi:hypothetical protein
MLMRFLWRKLALSLSITKCFQQELIQVRSQMCACEVSQCNMVERLSFFFQLHEVADAVELTYVMLTWTFVCAFFRVC